MADPKISLDEVRHVAELARLELSDDEAQTMRAQLDDILRYMAELDAVDVEGVEPTYHAIPMDAPLRRDVVQPSLPREETLAAAPAQAEGGFAVPRVLEVDE
ncbi:MAG: Asp-tRNA(Asn)/Glu-tRNA(Gln) amidotransferase subunit GatC [Polyangiales bacterium]